MSPQTLNLIIAGVSVLVNYISKARPNNSITYNHCNFTNNYNGTIRSEDTLGYKSVMSYAKIQEED